MCVCVMGQDMCLWSLRNTCPDPSHIHTLFYIFFFFCGFPLTPAPGFEDHPWYAIFCFSQSKGGLQNRSAAEKGAGVSGKPQVSASR